jgi:hypothetical protein
MDGPNDARGSAGTETPGGSKGRDDGNPPPPAANPSAAASDPWHERFNNVAAGVQSIVVSVAVLVAGAWAVYVYLVLQQPVAEGQLRDLRLKTALQGMLDLTLQARQLRDVSQRPIVDESGQMYVVIEVVVKNVGNKPVSFPLHPQDSGLHVALVKSGGTGDDYDNAAQQSHRDPTQTPPMRDTEIGVEPNGIERLTYLVKVRQPGVYCAVFRARVPEGDILLTNIPTKLPISWRAKNYFLVEEPAPLPDPSGRPKQGQRPDRRS